MKEKTKISFHWVSTQDTEITNRHLPATEEVEWINIKSSLQELCEDVMAGLSLAQLAHGSEEVVDLQAGTTKDEVQTLTLRAIQNSFQIQKMTPCRNF